MSEIIVLLCCFWVEKVSESVHIEEVTVKAVLKIGLQWEEGEAAFANQKIFKCACTRVCVCVHMYVCVCV